MLTNVVFFVSQPEVRNYLFQAALGKNVPFYTKIRKFFKIRMLFEQNCQIFKARISSIDWQFGAAIYSRRS